MNLIKKEYKTKVENGTKYEATEYSLGEHYEVEMYVTTYESGTVCRRIYVNVSYEDRHENYIPEIYFEENYFGKHMTRFEIQTASYGAMNPEEIQKVIAGYQEAVEAVEVLTKEFC